MSDLSKLLDVIGLFYDSVIEEAKWPEALRSLSDFVGGRGAFHIIADPHTGTIGHSESIDVDPIVNQLYLEYYSAKEVRLAPALPHAVGSILTEDRLIDRRAFKRSEIYGELLAPYDIPHVMFAWLQKQAQAFQTIVIEGSKSHGAFQQQALERFALVMPHLLRAVRIRDLLASARQSRRAYMDIMDGLPCGVVLLDQRGEVIEITRSAESLLRGADGLIYARRRVRATRREDDRHLQRAIQSAVRAKEDRTVPEETIVIQRADHQQPMSVTVIPVSAHERLTLAPQPAGLMFIVDPGRVPRPRVALIRQALDLTSAEAALAGALFSGVSLREAARLLGRSINTCKSQLKSIYAKTGCRSHVDLAKTLVMTAFARRPG